MITKTLWLDPDDNGTEIACVITQEQRDYLDEVRVSIGAKLAVFPKTSSGHVPHGLYRTYHSMVEAWQEAEDLVEAWDAAT